MFDIDLDQPEDAGSEDELEEGVRPGVPGWGAPSDRAGAAARAQQARGSLERGAPGGREEPAGGAGAPRGRRRGAGGAARP